MHSVQAVSAVRRTKDLLRLLRGGGHLVATLQVLAGRTVLDVLAGDHHVLLVVVRVVQFVVVQLDHVLVVSSMTLFVLHGVLMLLLDVVRRQGRVTMIFDAQATNALVMSLLHHLLLLVLVVLLAITRLAPLTSRALVEETTCKHLGLPFVAVQFERLAGWSGRVI